MIARAAGEWQEIAFAIAPQMEQAGDFDFAPIASEPIYALLPRDFAKPSAKSITLAELAELPVVLASGAAALRKMLNQELGRHGLEITKAFEVIQGQTMIAFAQVGLGAAVLPRLMIPKPAPGAADC